ncbi:hypothetical protein, partial [Burkholderia pseudomultivorans]|uniref:hypothetical protein n=1 Tax=Burkholderia pseudomultivorans TaxID=1207504 RepID=UPI001E5400E7
SILHQALGFVAALRFQQQRSEIMNRISQVVNNFLLHRCDCGVLLPSPAACPRPLHTTDSASPLAPRCRQRERGVILGTRDQTRKRFVKIF